MSIITVDGQPVHAAVAFAFEKLENAFRSATGHGLIISSGYRSHEAQIAFFLSRYRVQASGNGPYGDVRWWQGRRYVRVSGEGTVAVPGTSLHESFRAIDIRDTGADAGVTQAGTVRSNWIKNNAHRYGFTPNGFGFREPWHIEFAGALTVPAGGGAVPILPKPKEDDMADFRYFSRINPTTKKTEWAITHPLFFPDGVFVTNDISLANGFAPYSGNSANLDEAGRWEGMLKTAKLAYDAAWAAEAKRASLISTGGVTAEDIGAEVIRQMKLPGN